MENSKQAAYPTELKLSNQADKGFTKEEIAVKDFVCALLSNPSCTEYTRHQSSNSFEAELVSGGIAMAKEYFKQLKTLNK
jgi:hypothetical protein